MKFYQSFGPNPRVVKMFLQEKQVDIATVDIDVISGENRQPAYLAVNPKGQTPALETSEGVVITEKIAICEYLDEIYVTPTLIGKTPLARAITRMWCNRIEIHILEPMANGFRFAEGLTVFKDRIHCIPQAADDLKAIAQEQLSWLDGVMEGKEYIANDAFSLADIMLYSFLDFAQTIGQPINTDNKNIVQWFDRINARDSAAKSVYVAK